MAIDTSSLTNSLVAEFPDSSWSEEALNNLGTYYIVQDEDDLAAKAVQGPVRKVSARARVPNARRGSTAGMPT